MKHTRGAVVFCAWLAAAGSLLSAPAHAGVTSAQAAEDMASSSGAHGLSPATHRPQHIYRVDPWLDGTLSASALFVAGLFEAAVKPSLRGEANCRKDVSGRCDSQALWRGDRGSVRFANRGWRLFSDIGQTGGIVAGALAVAADAWSAPGDAVGARVATDVLVYVETLALASVSVELLKVAVRRPRPISYRDTAQLGLTQQVSFPSGHSTAVAAAATSAATSFALRHPDARARWAVWGFGGALTAGVAAGRVLGGKHFVSDVLAGAALGVACGAFVPWLHRLPVTLSVQPSASGGLSAQVQMPL